MALQITEQNGTMYLKGTLNSITSNACYNHLQFSLERNGFLVIDINQVDAIDVDGVTTLKALYKSALINNAKFYFTGNGCKELTEEVRFHYAA